MKKNNLIRWIIGLLILLFVFWRSVNDSRSTHVETAVLGAFPDEIAWLTAQMEDRKNIEIMGLEFTTGKIGGHKVLTGAVGIGKVNAGMSTGILLRQVKPERVIFSGVGGGINPDLNPGDIVIGQRTVQHDYGMITPDSLQCESTVNPLTDERNPLFFPADSLLLALSRKAANAVEWESLSTTIGQREPEIITGIIATGDVIINSTPKKSALRALLDADAVDMEGGAVAQVCHQFGVPCIVIRSLSDESDENAQADFQKFYKTAARNANRLVLTLIENLPE